MIYKDFKGLKLSALGFGVMRLPVIGGDDSRIDEAGAAELIDYAMGHGVNYYDTAWGYHGGNSEAAVGRMLKKYPRSSFYLASKFPGYDLSNMGKVREIFPEQLERCGVDCFDFYLFHNVSEKNIDGYLDPANGILEYLLEQRDKGRIRHLGFSAHGALDTIKRFLDEYGSHMEFCQIQLNWLDWSFQGAEAKVELLKSYGLPVWVMEPVRGGKLAGLAPEAEAVLKGMRPDWTQAEWAFRFVESTGAATVTLSGMSTLEQVKENVGIYERHIQLAEAEMQALGGLAAQMVAGKTLPCTKCRYCTAHCPQGLDIPRLLELYNEHLYSGGSFIAVSGVEALPEGRRPAACLGCRACEAVCPQEIGIAEAMAGFAEKLRA